MKTLIAATALIASVASASAMTSANTDIERYIGAEQAATLTDAQVLTALNFISGSDSESEKRAKVRSLVN